MFYFKKSLVTAQMWFAVLAILMLAGPALGDEGCIATGDSELSLLQYGTLHPQRSKGHPQRSKGSVSYRYPPLPRSIQGPERFDHALRTFPKNETWRLWMAWKDQHRGEFYYDSDKTPGYRMGMMRAFEHLRNTIGGPNNFSYVFDIHKHACQGVFIKKVKKSKAMVEPEPVVIGAGEGHHVHYPFHLDWATSAAKREWCDEQLVYYDQDALNADCVPKETAKKTFLLFFNHRSKRMISRVGWQPENATYDQRLEFAVAQMEKAWARYEAERKAAQTDDKVLAAIVRMLRYQRMAHLFTDGNGRIMDALLAKLLIENGFYPAILYDATRFGGVLSISEMVHEVKNGIGRFLSLRRSTGRRSQ